jgi:hypothetical protein
MASLAASTSSRAPGALPTSEGAAVGELSVKQFGARGDGRTNDYAAITAAVAEAERLSCDVVFPTGEYVFDRTLEFGVGGLRVIGRGKATLRYRGRGYAVSVDAGEDRIYYNHYLENLLVMGDGSLDQHGFLIRNFVHGVRRDLRVTNVGGIAFDIAGDVLSTYDRCRVADNETARPDRFPRIDFRIRGTAPIRATTACLFLNCMAERASAVGWQIDECDDSRWVGGTAEGIEGIGVQIAAKSGGNTFESFFMEMNSGGDLICSGPNNSFQECTATSHAKTSPYESVPSIHVARGSRGFAFTRGRAYAIIVDQAAENTLIAHAEIGHRIADSGRGTIVRDCRQGYNSATRFPSQTLGNIDNPDPLALDWYREATFAPLAIGSGQRGQLGLDAATGDSTRIGNVVFITLVMQIGHVRAPASGGLVIEGLPYAARNISVLTMAADGLDAAARWEARTEAGTTGLRIVTSANGQLAPVDARLLRTGTRLTISGQYMT